MRLELLNTLTDERGPFVTVCHDVSRLDTSGIKQLERRWEAAVRELTELGAEPATVEAVGERTLARTERHGRIGRHIVANGDQVLLDVVLPEPPLHDEVRFGSVPDLLPLFRSLCASAPYAVVRMDRLGADVEVVGLLGETSERESVQGTEDIVHKVGGGGWAQRRFQQRIENSWHRNASQVAHELEHMLQQHDPQLVLVLGDPQAIHALQASASHQLADRLVRLRTGGRAEGTSPELEQQAIHDAVADHVRSLNRALLDRCTAGLSRQQEAVDGRDAVVDALRRGQVEELLLQDEPRSSARLWVGEEPMQIGTSRVDAVTTGAVDPRSEPAYEVLAWAALGSGAGVTVLAGDGENSATLTDGVGALLRWTDPSTPYSAIPSMPGHGN